MRINIELLGNRRYRVHLIAENRIAHWFLKHITINVSHISGLGECGWIVYKEKLPHE